MSKQTNIPQLRFPEFKGEWEHLEIGDVFPQIVVGFVGTVSDSYCDKEVGIPFIRTLNVKDGYFSLDNIQYVTPEFHNSNEKSKIFNEDILIARVGANMGQVSKVEGLNTEANSANVIIIKRYDKNSSSFFTKYLSSDYGKKQIKARGAGGAQEVLNISVAKSIVVPHPSLPEQTKIANFLISIDKKIQALKKKHSLLEQYKKGVMQKLFSQELRFKDENGNEFPEWEEKQVKDLFKVTRGDVLAMSLVSDEIENDHIYPVYSSQTKNRGLAGYYNEYLFEDAITWTTDGAGAGDVNFREGKFYCTNVCGVLLSDEGYANLFIAELLNSVSRKYVSYVGNPKLMNNVMAEISIIIPVSVEEQQKISNFLKSQNVRIKQLEIEISKIENWIKGLLQKMFC